MAKLAVPPAPTMSASDLTHIATQTADFPWPPINQNFLDIYQRVLRENGQNPPPTQLMVEDIRPNAFRLNGGANGILIGISDCDQPAYAYEAYTNMRYMALGH
ncbi:hypothetical protein BGZ63DRAFT_405074 [Mariannaea sp. PMI_226]|nr:hypothetical protein BGZ63DRAFT_405074 [Mariannaea sp. PMI_226]